MNSASLNEIAYNILNNIREGRSSNNEYLSVDQIKFNVNYYRALLIRRDTERTNNSLQMFEQDLGIVDVDLFDTAEDSVEESMVDALRTTKKLPTPIRLKNKEAFTFIGGMDKTGEAIPLTHANRSYWSQFRKYSKGQPEAYFRNGYLYITNADDMDVINVRGVFEDPEDVFDFKNEALSIYTGNEPYPISLDMLQRITQSLMNGEFRLLAGPNDETLDNLQE